MGATKANPTVGQPLPSGGDRLESWKEIAGHFKRGVSTVQRWEKEEGLPVHRHVHDKLGTVYAYRAELDAWWHNGHTRLEIAEPVEKSSDKRRLWWGLAASAVALAAAGLVLGIATRKARQSALPFAERDWVLITRFENRTGEAVFDGTLEYALERELSNSQFVNVVPRERVADALGLMKRPLDTRVDAALGREICQRDGGIRALLTGRIEKLDNTYVFSASLVDPRSGVTAAAISEEAQGQREAVPTLRRLSNRVRESLGENLTLIEQSRKKLETVTTPSLRALQLYTQGMDLVNQYRWDPAAQLLEEALKEDPDFASAHILLAHCYSNVRKNDQAAPHYQKAYAQAELRPDWERYFILGSYYERHLGDREKAIGAYEVLVRLYPDHYWGVTNISYLYYEKGEIERALRVYTRRADLRPNDFLANYAAWELANLARDTSLSARYLERARRLVTAEDYELHPIEAIDLEFAQAHESLRKGDPAAVLREIRRLEQTYPSRPADARIALTRNLSDFYFRLGMLKASREWIERCTASDIRAMYLTELAEETGDRKALRAALRHQLGYETSLGPATVARLARVGLVNEANRLIGRFETRGFVLAHIDFARGEVALAQGREQEGISRLRAAIPGMHHLKDERVSWAAESLVRTLVRRGDLAGAIQVLEPLDKDQLLRPVVQLYLADLYRKDNQEPQARAMEEKLRRLLAYADPDHPILAQLKGSDNLALVAPPK